MFIKFSVYFYESALSYLKFPKGISVIKVVKEGHDEYTIFQCLDLWDSTLNFFFLHLSQSLHFMDV